jgi:hypothetical protein
MREIHGQSGAYPSSQSRARNSMILRKTTAVSFGPAGVNFRSVGPQWYGDYKDANGITRRVPLKTDKAASEARLNELVQNEERRSTGLFDPYEEHRRRPLSEHIDEYNEFLSSKGNPEDVSGGGGDRCGARRTRGE